MDFGFDIHLVATFFLLVGLELVLGIDNVLLISIITGRLPHHEQEKARKLGLSLALVVRLGMLLGVSLLQKLTAPILLGLSVKDLILLGGGILLIYKATREIHHVVQGAHEDESEDTKIKLGFKKAIFDIVLMDIVFSIDSVITGVGLTQNLLVIYASVIASFVLVLCFARQVSEFVQSYPELKILALSFLVCIGMTLCLEAFHHEIPKSYIYLPMGFSLVVELLQMRYDKNRKRAKK